MLGHVHKVHKSSYIIIIQQVVCASLIFLSDDHLAAGEGSESKDGTENLEGFVKRAS